MTLLRSRPSRHAAPSGWVPEPPGDDVLEAIEPDRDAEFRPWRPSRRLRALLLANFAMATFYLTWWLAPGHVGTPMLFYLLAAAEAFNFMHLLGLWWAIWATKVDPPPKHRTAFSIDVFIPTCGEPLDVLTRTIKAAVGMDLAHTTYVCDDANSPEVKVLAEKLGAKYIARTSNRGFKAGNLNHALVRTEGELFAMFDADHVPRKDFLKRVVGYFEDPTVGFVQTPQYYGNSADNAVARGAYQQQAIFYGPIMRGKNGMAAAFCCGTNAVFRRVCLEEVGGFDEKSVVEDFVTSMRIHRRGWRSVYYPYVLADGLGPTNLKSYFKQQFRWARGSIGGLFSLEPFKPGFTLGQRVQYLLATTFYLIGLVTAIYVALPIVYLLTGLSAFSLGSGTFILFYAPYVLLALVTIRWGLGGQLRLEHVRYTYGSFPVYGMAAIAALFHIPARFKVTRKDAEDRPRPPVLAWVTVLAFVATLVAMFLGVLLRPLHARTITNISWGFINLLLLGGIGGVAVRELVARRRPEMVRIWETARLVRSLRPIAGAAPGVAVEGFRRLRGGLAVTESRRLVLPEYAVPPEMPAAPRAGVRNVAWQVAALTMLGFMLRLALINIQSLRLDESLSLAQVHQYSLVGLWHYLIASNVHVPLYHTILHFWVGMFGDSEWVIRIPSVIFGTAAIPLVYVVGKRLIGPRAAVFATAIGAASPFWVWHSDEARMYPLLLFMTLASLALLFKAVEEGGRWRWIAYAAVTGLSLYSHYFALLMLPVHLAYLLIHRVSWRKLLAWGGAMAGVVLIFAPWMIALYFLRIHVAGGGVGSLANSVRIEPNNTGVTGILYGSMFFVMVYVIGYALALGHGVGILALLSRVATGGWPVMAFLGVTRKKVRRLRGYRTAMFIGAWLVLTMGVVFILNVFHPGLWLQRYLIIASPAVFLAVASGVARVIRLRFVVVVLAFLTLGSATVMENANAANPLEENFRDASALVSADYHPGDVVFMLPYFNAVPFRYYFSPSTAVVGYDRSAGRIMHKLLPRLAKQHPGASMWTVIDTFDLKEDPAQRALGRTVPGYLQRNYAKTGGCSLGRLELVRYELPSRQIRGGPEHNVSPWASCVVNGRNIATFGSEVTIDRNLAWFLAIANLLCILGAAAAFWYSRRSAKRRRLGVPKRRFISRGGLEPEVQVPVDNGPVAHEPVASLSGNGPGTPSRAPADGNVTMVKPAPSRRAVSTPAPNPSAARAVVQAPSAAPAPDGDEVLAKLVDPDPFLRITAIGALKGRPDVDRLLVRALRDEFPLVRREAVRALRELGSSQATEALIEVAGHDPSAEVREEAVAALGQLVRERHGNRF